MNGADFFRATASGTAFSGADLRSAGFNNAQATGAIFTGADLRATKLLFTNLTGANLRNAKFGSDPAAGDGAGGTEFSWANLTNADLSGATGIPYVGEGSSAATWSNTTCPDRTNSDNNGGTCVGHFIGN